jgi:hypothetical protein
MSNGIAEFEEYVRVEPCKVSDEALAIPDFLGYPSDNRTPPGKKAPPSFDFDNSAVGYEFDCAFNRLSPRCRCRGIGHKAFRQSLH